MEINLRPFNSEDFEALWKLDQVCFPPGIAYSQLELMHYIRRQNAFTTVAEMDGTIVGFSIGERIRNRGHVITLDVAEEFRGRGVGSKLMAEVEAHLQADGCDTVLLETAVNNVTAIKFYKHHGYAILKTIPRYYEGNLDALLMGKRLSVNEQRQS